MCYVHNQWYDISCATLYYVCVCVCVSTPDLINQHANCIFSTQQYTVMCVQSSAARFFHNILQMALFLENKY